MARAKSKGSIILEIIIVVLLVALFATILYPKKVWEREDKNTAICRDNMDRIFKAELIYQKYHNNYTDTLQNIISFIKNDTTKQVLREYFLADSALAENMTTFLKKTDAAAEKIVNNLIADTLMYAIIEAINYDSNLATVILQRLEKTPLKVEVAAQRVADSSDVFVLNRLNNQVSGFDIYNPIKDDDSLKLVFQRMMPEIQVGSLLDTLYSLNTTWAQKIDSAVFATMDRMSVCPTVNKPYKITVIDTSVIKYVEISCPIDSSDIENIKGDFVLYRLGHLRISNHGKIETGEKSWIK
ncbi:MAG: hypothetical protein MUC94_00270 [bacterium]|nr:hypothetical protein [bacterium]